MEDKLKILIVEDSKSVLALYNAGLADAVFDKRLVADGSEALKVYDSWQPDIIILDIVLPGMSGYAVLKEIREEIEDKTTTIIMATSMSSKDDITDCMKLGIQGYIIKPFKYKEVTDKVLQYYQSVNPERVRTAQVEYKKALEEMKEQKVLEKRAKEKKAEVTKEEKTSDTSH